MQRLVEKFGSRRFVVLAVNISEKQDDKVVPFLREHGYDFTALKADSAVIEAYGVDGVPEEFLIDGQGKLVARVRLNSDESERQVAARIEGLLR